MSTTSGLAVLEDAYRQILGEGFGDELRSLVESRRWFSPDLNASEMFRLWVCDNVESCQASDWIFQPIRAGERRQLAQLLGVEIAPLAGRGPVEIATALLGAIRMPSTAPFGRDAVVRGWEDAIESILRGEDEKAATKLRQLSERTLKILLSFYAWTEWGSRFVEILHDPGSLRIPRSFEQALKAESVDLVSLMSSDGWADLGFLTMALRKFSSRLKSAEALLPNGQPLQLFEQSDADAFLSLATALQPYAHDKPSVALQRTNNLTAAAQEALRVVHVLVGRGVFPQSAVVLAAGQSVYGPSFRGIDSSAQVRCVTCSVLPDVSARVYLLAASNRPFSHCIWAPAPW